MRPKADCLFSSPQAMVLEVQFMSEARPTSRAYRSAGLFCLLVVVFLWRGNRENTTHQKHGKR